MQYLVRMTQGITYVLYIVIIIIIVTRMYISLFCFCMLLVKDESHDWKINNTFSIISLIQLPEITCSVTSYRLWLFVCGAARLAGDRLIAVSFDINNTHAKGSWPLKAGSVSGKTKKSYDLVCVMCREQKECSAHLYDIPAGEQMLEGLPDRTSFSKIHGYTVRFCQVWADGLPVLQPWPRLSAHRGECH